VFFPVQFLLAGFHHELSTVDDPFLNLATNIQIFYFKWVGKTISFAVLTLRHFHSLIALKKGSEQKWKQNNLTYWNTVSICFLKGECGGSPMT